jgi:hypothetical protein
MEGRMRWAVAAALLGSGCGSFLCDEEAIRAILRAPLVSGEDALGDTLAGNLEARRDESAVLDAVEAAIEGRPLPGRGLSVWLQRGLDHTLDVSLRFPTPLRPGDALPVVGVHARGSFWGTVPDPPPGVTVGVKLDAFEATSAGGTARVVGVDPLRVDLDILASGPGRELRIAGRLTVRHETSTESCFQ